MKTWRKVLQITSTKCVHFKVFIDETATSFGPHWPIIRECCCAKRSQAILSSTIHGTVVRLSMCDLQRRICTVQSTVMCAPCIFYYCFYCNQQMQINITKVSFYILLHVSNFLCHHQGVLHSCLAKLHEFLKLNLLKSQFHKIIKIY
jgi:hypothetical protein